MIFDPIKSPLPPSPIEEINVAFPWLLALRWGEVACQILLVLVIGLLIDIDFPVIYLGLIIGMEAFSNLFLQLRYRQGRSVSESTIFILFVLDSLLLTGLLHLTGGAMNPFTFLYLVHIVIASIILTPRRSWIIILLTLLCYGLLFLPPPVTQDLSGILVPESSQICHLPGETSGAILLHLKGMWAAFAITSFFIIFFVSKIQKALANHNNTLLSLKETRLHNEQLASLTGLAAGAAHELSTPLSTIAVAVGEMIHELKENPRHRELLEDARLIREQVTGCKEILYQMAAGAGELRGEERQQITIHEAIEKILAGLDHDERLRIQVLSNCNDLTLHVGTRTLCRTLKGVLINGLEASPPASPVTMRWSVQQDLLSIQIRDDGTGMSPDVLNRATEPFFSTRETGMGLGLFLARTMADQYDGHVTVNSTAGKGTTVTIALSLQQIVNK